MYNLDPQPVKKKSSCLGKIFKGILIIIGLFIALIVIVSIVNPNTSSRTTTARSVAANATATPVLTKQQIEASAKTITFKELARNTEQHEGELLKFDGKVVQVIEDSGDYQLRINVTKGESGFWDDTVFVMCPDCPTRPLEDDIVSFAAVVDGRLTYKSTMGGEITLPQLTARTFDVISDK